ncbi:MAG: hypothetical protein IPM12_14835 [Flavobacteriales bacterium]|nr:hypothetical protein [Flavobacteriales bacterium]
MRHKTGNGIRMLQLACLFMGSGNMVLAQESEPVIRGSGFLRGGYNRSLNEFTPGSGLNLIMGTDYYFDSGANRKLRYGLSVDWLQISVNAGRNDYEEWEFYPEMQLLRPGLLLSLLVGSNTVLDLKYIVMPTAGVLLINQSNDGPRGRSPGSNTYASWGFTHGPYVGLKAGRFMSGVELPIGNLWFDDSEGENGLDKELAGRLPWCG